MYHLNVTLSTARRIIAQLRHDRRSIALMFIAPLVLMSLLWWVFSDSESLFDRVGPALLGVFPFVIMFLITSITTLRERSSGTLERLLTLPISRADFIAGYAIAFGLFGAIQSVLTSTFAIYFLGLSVEGSQWLLVGVAVLDTLLGVALGLFVSAFARSEFQAVQFMPALIFPQLIICGLFVPLAQLPSALEAVARWMPLTYAVEALNEVTSQSNVTATIIWDGVVIAAWICVALVCAGMTLKRKNA